MEEIGGIPAFVRRAGDARVLYLHGLASSSDEWVPLLGRVGGVAPDLPGFGRSAKGGDRRYDPEEYADWLEELTAGWDAFAVVGREWGARLGAVLARRGRVTRLVAVDPELPSGRRARMWPRSGLGELAMALTFRHNFFAPRAAWPSFDQGTQRAILRLYRSGEPPPLGRDAIVERGPLDDAAAGRIAAHLVE